MRIVTVLVAALLLTVMVGGCKKADKPAAPGGDKPAQTDPKTPAANPTDVPTDPEPDMEGPIETEE